MNILVRIAGVVTRRSDVLPKADTCIALNTNCLHALACPCLPAAGESVLHLLQMQYAVRPIYTGLLGNLQSLPLF
jgi:hypothetical protein